MNETETEQLYQIIFRGDRSEGWQSWKRNLAAAASRNESIPCEVGEAQKDPDNKHHNFKAGEKIQNGYRMIRVPIHPRASNGYVQEHILISESALGTFLPAGAVVHHVNENTLDNRPDNLVVCENNGVHMTLHRRARAMKACGHADWLKCVWCQTWDDPANLHHTGTANYHKACRSAWGKANYLKRKEKEGEFWKKRPEIPQLQNPPSPPMVSP